MGPCSTLSCPDTVAPCPGFAQVKKKAEHTVRVVIRHDSPALLEKLRSLPLVMQRTLETSISVPVYGSNAEAVTGGKTMDGPLPLLDGASKALFVGPVPEDKMPKDAGPGKTLVGSLLLGKCAYNGGKASPGAMPLALPCPAAKEDKKNADMPKKDDGDSKSPADKFREAMRDAKIKFLKDLKTDADDAKELYDTMRKELLLDFPGYLPVLLEHMNRLNSVEGDKRTLEALRLIIQAAEVVVSVVDIPALAAHVARKCMDEDESQEAVATRALLNAQKAALIEALACKCTALLDIEEAEAKDAVEHGSQESAPET